jgi:hypothetical protein
MAFSLRPGGTKRNKPVAARMSSALLATAPVRTAGSLKRRRPPWWSRRAHSDNVVKRSGRWQIASMQRTASKVQCSKGSRPPQSRTAKVARSASPRAEA